MTRDWNISACRWAATCCIVACHIMQYYENCLAYWFNIGVQVFFIISGYLYCNKQVSQPLRFLTRNWLKILIPCEIFLIGTLFAFYVVGVDLPPTKECIRVVLLSQTIPGCGHLWFISQILFCYLSIPVLHGVRIEMSECGKARYVVIVSAIIAVICCICIGYRTHVRADCFVCFIVGFFLCDYNKRFASIDKTFIKLLIFSGGLAFIVRISLMLNGCLDGDIYILDMWLKAAVAMAFFFVLRALLQVYRQLASPIFRPVFILHLSDTSYLVTWPVVGYGAPIWCRYVSCVAFDSNFVFSS